MFFSLPVFWVAVILKDLGGIRLNDWFRDGGELSTVVIALGAISMAILAYSIAGGRLVAPGHHRYWFRRGLRRLPRLPVAFGLVHQPVDRMGPDPAVGGRRDRCHGDLRRHRQPQGPVHRSHGRGDRVGVVFPAPECLRRRLDGLDEVAPDGCDRDRGRCRHRLRVRRLRQGLVRQDRRPGRIPGRPDDLRRPAHARVLRVHHQLDHPRPADQDDRRPRDRVSRATSGCWATTCSPTSCCPPSP